MVAYHDLAFTFQDDQQHVHARALNGNELAGFRAGEHSFQMCTSGYEHAVEFLRAGT
jgi:hypothetical protein